VTIGDKNFTEEYILGSLYAQALAAKGYKVTVKGQHRLLGDHITRRSSRARSTCIPNTPGPCSPRSRASRRPRTARSRPYAEAQSFAHKHGFTLLDQTPFYDSDALGALKAYASAHGLSSIADLKKLGTSVKLGGAPEFATRFEGLVGLKKAYGINPTFVPLAIGLTYKALDTGQVQVSDVFTTDPQLTTGKYTILSDPRKVFRVPERRAIVKQSVVNRRRSGLRTDDQQGQRAADDSGDSEDERRGRARPAAVPAGRASVPRRERAAVAARL